MKSGKITMSADLHNSHELTQLVKDELIQRGIKEFGITDYEGVCSIRPLLQCSGRARLEKSIASPKSIIICLFPYLNEIPQKRNLSLYAGVADYHKVIQPVLKDICQQLESKTGGEFISFTDSSPIPEVFSASRAGLGVIGDNGLLINERYGSFVFIGEIVTSLELETVCNEIGECLHCGVCKMKCPTQCLDGKCTHCLSDITQKKGELSAWEKSLIKKSGIVWGCDECQLCCPMNKNAAREPFAAFVCDESSYYITLDEVDERLPTSAFSFRGDKPIKRNLMITKVEEKL